MLSVPTVSTMLTVIGVALFATAALIVLLSVLFARTQSTPKPAAPIARVPAQRQGDRRTPVTTH